MGSWQARRAVVGALELLRSQAKSVWEPAPIGVWNRRVCQRNGIAMVCRARGSKLHKQRINEDESCGQVLVCGVFCACRGH